MADTATTTPSLADSVAAPAMPSSDARERTVRVPAPHAAAVGLRLLCVSDTHDFHKAMPGTLPHADILVHAGDFTCRGTRAEVASFVGWMRELLDAGLVRHVVCIAGNHELGLEPGRAKHPVVVRAHEAMRQSLRDVPKMHFLEDSGCTVCGLSFHGSPWTLPISGKPCGDWAFQLKDRPGAGGIGAKFAKIPEQLDVLVTHMMPFGKLDELPLATKPTTTSPHASAAPDAGASGQPRADAATDESHGALGGNCGDPASNSGGSGDGSAADGRRGVAAAGNSASTAADGGRGAETGGAGGAEQRWKRIGSVQLMERVAAVAPALHVFGHFHMGHGVIQGNDRLRTTFVNAAVCDEDYRPDQSPFVVEFVAAACDSGATLGRAPTATTGAAATAE